MTWSVKAYPAARPEVTVGAVLAVAVVYALGAAVPFTCPRFPERPVPVLHLGTALMTAFIVVPLGTVLLEEVAFRGVLLGLVNRHRGAAWASITSSVLFGLWHIRAAGTGGRARTP
jgi:uncharacterized protein